jgi:hypothetical protein
MPLDANAMAADFAPHLIADLNGKKAEIIASAPGVALRWALKLAWGWFIGWVPWLIGRGIEYAAKTWGKMTLEELVASLVHVNAVASLGPPPIPMPNTSE